MRPLILLFSAAVALAQCQPQSIVRHTFEGDTEGWMVMGSNGSVKVSADAKSGKGALQFSYSLDGKGFSTAILPAGAGRLADMRRIRFWVKADHDTALAIVLAEKKPGGGDYSNLVWAPANVWQHIDLSLTEFVSNDGPNDAVDPDGKLDPDQVEGIGIVDFSTFFNQMPEAMPMVVTRKSGMHHLLIDDFEVLDGAAAETKPKPETALIDSFDRGFSQWITFGGMSLTLSPSDNPIGGPALAASLKAVEGKLAIMMRRTNSGEFTGMKRLAFDIAAEHEGTFAISIETMKSGSGGGPGPRYNFMIYPPEGRKVFHVNVKLSDFEHDENSPDDPAGQIEASRIKSIAIGDISALTGGAAIDKKIWIGRVEMLK